MDEPKFEGLDPRECGEHRTLGRRAWCFACSQYCSPTVLCNGCELSSVMAERDRLQAIVDGWAGDGAEYRHALDHVVDCTEGCEQCRDLAQATLDRTTMGKPRE